MPEKMLYITRDDKDTLITYLQNMREHDTFLEGYEEGFQRAVNMACDLINVYGDYENLSENR